MNVYILLNLNKKHAKTTKLIKKTIFLNCEPLKTIYMTHYQSYSY